MEPTSSQRCRVDLDERLHHSSALGDFWLTSDAITHTYSNRTRPSRLVEVLQQISASEVTAFFDLGCTIGAYTVFPYPVKEAGRWRQSINQARGMSGKIGDRFDLTLECIRRHYNGADSPLTNAFYPYASFFGLFDNFTGYVDHFLLNDLVTDDYAEVRFHIEFDDFQRSPLPQNGPEEYRTYMRRSMHFIRARNKRIERLAGDRASGLGELSVLRQRSFDGVPSSQHMNAYR